MPKSSTKRSRVLWKTKERKISEPKRKSHNKRKNSENTSTLTTKTPAAEYMEISSSKKKNV